MLFAEEIANNAVLRKLDAIQNRTDLMYPNPDEFGRMVFDTNKDDKDLQELIGLMDETFITKKGHPNYENINWFKEHGGYRVFPGEKDSFGWLTAGIRKLGGPVLWFG